MQETPHTKHTATRKVLWQIRTANV